MTNQRPYLETKQKTSPLQFLFVGQYIAFLLFILGALIFVVLWYLENKPQ